MENSEKILFDDDKPQWYLALGSRWVGPMTAADIYERIMSHQISWAHYVWRKGQADWKRLCDTKAFQAAVPQQPAKDVQKEVKDASKPVVRQSVSRTAASSSAGVAGASDGRVWYLHYNSSQYGPFSLEEVRGFLKLGKIHARVHGWREGMKNWDRLERIEAFKDLLGPKVADVKKSSAEQRSNPRRPLLAKILMTDEQSVIVGVCRDISIGGLQVLTDRLPANVGAKLKMNISPSTNDSGKPIEPFVAEGVIVRILEDGRGFSFRFERLTERAKQAIEAYIDSPL